MGVYPIVLSIQIFDDVLCERDGGSAWGVEFLGVVDFFHCYLILRCFVHQASQIAIDCEEDIDPDDVIACIKESPVCFRAIAFNFG